MRTRCIRRPCRSVVQTDMGDTDVLPVSRLIALVRQRPVLWDRQQEVYKNRKLTRKAWAEICEDLIDGYVGLSDSEKKAIGKNVIGKWANLRDNWLRYWRKRQELVRIGSSTKSLKKYIHHDQLLFLSKVYDDQETEQEVEEIQVDVDVISDPEMDSTQSNSSDNTSHNLWNVLAEENKLEDTYLQTQAESHLYFFQSIMPMISELNNDQVLDFQAAVLESIKRIKFGGNYVNITQGHTLPLLALIPAPATVPVTRKDHPSNIQVSKATNTENDFRQLQPPKQETEDASRNQNSTAIEDKDMSAITSVLEQTEKSTNVEVKPQEAKGIQQLVQEADLLNLHKVINKLERISKNLVASPFTTPNFRYGAYIGSLLQGLSPRKIQYLTRKIIREILRVKSLQKQKTLDSLKRKSALRVSALSTNFQEADVKISLPKTSKDLSPSSQKSIVSIRLSPLTHGIKSLGQDSNHISSDSENNKTKSLDSSSPSLGLLLTDGTSPAKLQYNSEQTRECIEIRDTKSSSRPSRKRQKVLSK